MDENKAEQSKAFSTQEIRQRNKMTKDASGTASQRESGISNLIEPRIFDHHLSPQTKTK